MIVGPTKALFMDEISTGLDSSTTFQIVKCLSQFCHVMDATIMMSLLQPAPETFELFDDVVLLSEGQVVYQGPREHVLEFFESCGFKCPDRKGIADFLQEVSLHLYLAQEWPQSFLAKLIKNPKAPFTLQRLKAQRNKPFHWQKGASYSCLFTQVHFIHKLSTWGMNFFWGWQRLDGSLVDPVWKNTTSSWSILTISQSKS